MNGKWAFLGKGRNGEADGGDATGRQDWEHPPVQAGPEGPNPRPRTEYEQGGGPIEPEGRRFRPSLIKWLIFLVLVGYALVNFYRVPILQGAGGFLVVQDPPEQADLIVCLMGLPVERGLAAADLYAQGLAPRIFFARQKPPDGLDALKQKGWTYPDHTELLIAVLRAAGVPPSAWVTDDRPVESTYEEATAAKATCERGRFRSMIVVTSPAHTRRAGLIFRHVLSGSDVEVRVAASPYSGFRSEDWWKSPRYWEEVVLEYQKLLYHTLKHLW